MSPQVNLIFLPAVDCSPLEQPTNGSIQIVGEVPQYMESSIAVYECDAGYELDGVSALICLPDGQWSHLPPQCLPEECDVEKLITS